MAISMGSDRHTDLVIHKAEAGGYVVMHPFANGRPTEIYSPVIFASTSISEALQFIRDRMEPTTK